MRLPVGLDFDFTDEEEEPHDRQAVERQGKMTSGKNTAHYCQPIFFAQTAGWLGGVRQRISQEKHTTP